MFKKTKSKMLPSLALCMLWGAPAALRAQPANAVEIQIKADQVASHSAAPRPCGGRTLSV
jgi:hypothetical protein